MSFRFQVFDRTEEGVIASSHPLCLEINDLGKAMTTFEMDILACHMAIEIASSKAGISKREIGVDLDSGVLDLSPYDGNLSDTVFDDCLDFCEFILNRITPHSDKAIKTIMTHARFTLSHILKQCKSPEGSRGKTVFILRGREVSASGRHLFQLLRYPSV